MKVLQQLLLCAGLSSSIFAMQNMTHREIEERFKEQFKIERLLMDSYASSDAHPEGRPSGPLTLPELSEEFFKSPEDIAISFAASKADPLFFREIIYKYGQLMPREVDTIDGEEPFLKTLIKNSKNLPFILNGQWYLFGMRRERVGPLNATDEKRIEYFKTMFAPHAETLKSIEGVRTALLCLKRMQKNTGLKIPKFVLFDGIFAQVNPLFSTKRRDTIFFEKEMKKHIELLDSEDKDPVVQFLINDFGTWYNEEVKKLMPDIVQKR
jgi:hypothetical protein